MAGEIRVQASLQVIKDSIRYLGQPTAYTDDMAGSKGPVIGAVTVPTTGKLIYFTELTTPGYARFSNQDPEDGNYVEVGVYDPQTGVFYPFLELLPGKPQVVFLTRNFGEQYAGSGTGTTGPENYLRLKANGASVNVLIEIFER